MTNPPWYAKGLRFECQRSGHCCTGEPGTVRMNEEEVVALAGLLGLDYEVFVDTYARRLPDGAISLRERLNHDCVFYDAEKGCEIYELRPRQCRTWPFWRVNVHSRRRWERTAKTCPGMNRGPLYDADFIRKTSESDGTSGRIPPE